MHSSTRLCRRSLSWWGMWYGGLWALGLFGFYVDEFSYLLIDLETFNVGSRSLSVHIIFIWRRGTTEIEGRWDTQITHTYHCSDICSGFVVKWMSYWCFKYYQNAVSDASDYYLRSWRDRMESLGESNIFNTYTLMNSPPSGYLPQSFAPFGFIWLW